MKFCVRPKTANVHLEQYTRPLSSETPIPIAIRKLSSKIIQWIYAALRLAFPPFTVNSVKTNANGICSTEFFLNAA